MSPRPPPKLDEAKFARAHDLARTRLGPYTKLVWPAINPGVKLSWSWHHDVLCEALEAVTLGLVRRLIVNVPPGYTKTTIVSEAWPTWPAEFCEHPERRWIYASHSRDLTRAHNVIRRGVLESDWYREAFAPPKEAGIATDQNTQGFFKTVAEGWHMATSVKSKVTGWHGDRQVIDDPLDASGIWTAELDACIQWWSQKFKSRQRDECAVVLIMQRLHARDLTGFFLSPEGNADGNWLHVCLPERYEPKRRCAVSFSLRGQAAPGHWRQLRAEGTEVHIDDIRSVPGEVLDPKRYPEERVERLWSATPISIRQAQRQQDPQLGESSLFPAGLWRFWHSDLVRCRELNAATEENPDWPLVELLPPIDDLRLACAWDTTFDAGQSTDFCVALMGGRAGALIYLLHETRDRMDLVRAEAELEALVTRYPQCRTWLLEKSANGPGIVSRYRRKVGGIRLVGVAGESKEQRAESITPIVRARQVLLPHPEIAPWVLDLIAELEAFPRGRYDDRVDALVHLVRHLQEGMGDTPFAPRPRPEPTLPRAIAISPDGEVTGGPPGEALMALAKLDRLASREQARAAREARRVRRAGEPVPKRTRWTLEPER